MRKKLVALLSVVMLMSCLMGCSAANVELDEPTVTSYLESMEIPDDVTIIYDNVNGVDFLSDLNDSANSKTMATWVNIGGHCELKGKFDGVWLYGFGTNDMLFYGVSESDKDGLYALMDDFKAQFEDK